MSDKTIRFASDAEQAGYAALPNVVLFDAQITDGAKLTYASLIHFARRNESCWPGLERLAILRGKSERQVRAHVAELKKTGLVTVERRGQGKTNLYRLAPLTDRPVPSMGGPEPEEPASPPKPSPYDAEWKEWLEHYRTVTGNKKVRGSRRARSQFNARRDDGYTLDDLKRATIGNYSDDWLRANGRDVPETILRDSNIARYIKLAEKAEPEPVPDEEDDLPDRLRAMGMEEEARQAEELL